MTQEYSYRSAPTIKAFSRDNTWIRAIMGPFGSGKTSGAGAIECYNRAIAQEPGLDGVRRTKFAAVRNCYDDQTEILTELKGWQLFKDLLPEDRVATLNSSNELVYLLPVGVAVHQYDGEMIGFRGESVNFLVTPEHKLWVSIRRTRKKIWGDFEGKTAEDIFNNYSPEHVRVRKDVIWKDGVTQYSVDWFELFGFLLAEGNSEKSGAVVISNNDEEYVLDLLRRNDLSATTQASLRQFRIGKHDAYVNDLHELFSPLGYSHQKYIPQIIKNAPPANLRALLDGFCIGDGNVCKGTARLYTSSKQLANDLQEVAIKAGYAANLNHRDRTGKILYINGVKTKCNHIEYVVTLLGPKKYQPVLRGDKCKTGWYTQQYSGKVYCVELPEVPVCVRRKGQYFWALRSFPQLRDTTVPTFLHWLGELGIYKSSEYDFYLKTEHPIDHSPVESIICFRALDRPQDIRNLLSVEYTGAFFNEMKEISKSIIDGMSGRVNRYPPKNADGTGGATWSGMWGDTNPPDVDSWFYKFFEVDKPSKCIKCRNAMGGFILMDRGICPVCHGIESTPLAVIFKQPSGLSKEAENLPFLATDYYATLAAGKDQDFVNVFVHGQYGYVRDGKPVFPNFDSTWHQSKEALKALPGYPIILGFDNTGMNQGCVACQYLPNGQFVILHEWLFPDMGTRRLARDHVRPFIFNHYPGAQLYITHDPAGIRRSDTDERTSVMELMEAFQVNPMPARSNALQARFNAVDTLLMKRLQGGQPALIVSSECQMVIHGFMGEYRYRRLQVMGRERYVDKPEKNMVANLMDAVQYACMFVEDMFDLMMTNRNNENQIIVPTEDLWAAYT